MNLIMNIKVVFIGILLIVTSKLCAIVAIFYVYILIIGTITMGVCYMVKPE